MHHFKGAILHYKSCKMHQISKKQYFPKALLIGILFLLAFSGVVWYKISEKQDDAQGEIRQELKTMGYAAQAVIVREVNFSDAFSYRGTVEPGKIITLVAETEGKIAYCVIEKGKAVVKGSTLVKVDATKRLSAYVISQETYEKAKSDYGKLKELQQSGNASGMEVENAKLQMQNAAAQVDICRKQVEETSVRAPETGTIIDKKVNQGEYVSPGSPLGSIACLDRVLVRVFVQENEITRLKPGTIVTVKADAYPGTTFPGKISAVIPVASEAKTFPVEISIANNKPRKLFAGMNVSVVFWENKQSKALVIPRSSLTGDKGQAAVYVIHHSLCPVLTPIVSGREYDTYLSISKGLKAGDTVMTSGLLNVEPGKKIQKLTILP